MATHLSIHVWRIPCLVDYSARGRKESATTEATEHTRTHLSQTALKK